MLRPAFSIVRRDAGDLVQLHAQQIAAADRPHVEAADVVLGAERDHFVEGGTDFIADHGERKTGQGHAATLLSAIVFG